MTHLDEFTLQEYADDALDTEQQQIAANHLAVCSQCQAELTTLQQLSTMFNALADEPLTTDLSSRVLDQLQAEETQSEDIWQRWSNPILLAQLILFVVMVVILWPTIQTTLQTANQLLFNGLSNWQVPQLLIWEELASWTTAVYTQTRSLQPTFNLPASQWYGLLAFSLLLWLIANRLIFTDMPTDQDEPNNNQRG